MAVAEASHAVISVKVPVIVRVFVPDPAVPGTTRVPCPTESSRVMVAPGAAPLLVRVKADRL